MLVCKSRSTGIIFSHTPAREFNKKVWEVVEVGNDGRELGSIIEGEVVPEAPALAPPKPKAKAKKKAKAKAKPKAKVEPSADQLALELAELDDLLDDVVD